MCPVLSSSYLCWWVRVKCKHSSKKSKSNRKLFSMPYPNGAIPKFLVTHSIKIAPVLYTIPPVLFADQTLFIVHVFQVATVLVFILVRKCDLGMRRTSVWIFPEKSWCVCVCEPRLRSFVYCAHTYNPKQLFTCS